jgi:CheY-like chemotaxis protein
MADVDAAVGRLLVGAVSHGVRTPLHSLLGFLELLATTDLDTEARTLLSEARAGGDELLAASDRLLILVRLLAGESEAPRQSFSPADLLRDIAITAGPDGAIWIDANPYLPASLRGDAESLRQLLTELATNAVRHGATQTRIYAERASAFSANPVRVRFTVSDDGPGLPPDALRRLTGPEDRVASDTGQIGLFLARRLAKRLGTELSVARSDDRGTVLTFEVSVYDQAENEAVESLFEPVAARTLKVLLVEDNSVNRILAQRQMARLGHQLDIVTDGESGVRAVLDGDYDVVLMDRHLPDIDGVESARRIRAEELGRLPVRRTPIIAVTADASPGHREECLAAGMDDFLTKPLDMEQLRMALEAVTSRQALARPDCDPGAIGRLSAALDGDASAVAELVATYLDELPVNRMRLQAALGKAEARQAAAAAESLWAASETVGAIRLAQLCEEIHHAARGGDVERGRALLPALRETCERTASALDLTLTHLAA